VSPLSTLLKRSSTTATAKEDTKEDGKDYGRAASFRDVLAEAATENASKPADDPSSLESRTRATLALIRRVAEAMKSPFPVTIRSGKAGAKVDMDDEEERANASREDDVLDLLAESDLAADMETYGVAARLDSSGFARGALSATAPAAAAERDVSSAAAGKAESDADAAGDGSARRDETQVASDARFQLQAKMGAAVASGLLGAKFGKETPVAGSESAVAKAVGGQELNDLEKRLELRFSMQRSALANVESSVDQLTVMMERFTAGPPHARGHGMLHQVPEESGFVLTPRSTASDGMLLGIGEGDEGAED